MHNMLVITEQYVVISYNSTLHCWLILMKSSAYIINSVNNLWSDMYYMECIDCMYTKE